MNWFKQLFGISDKTETDEMGLPKVSVEIPMLKVKPTKGDDISEPVLSFVKCVQENPKRFNAYSDTNHCYIMSTNNPEDYKAYKIYDKVAEKGWYLCGCYYSNVWFIGGYPGEGGPMYSDPFFLTEDEKSFIIREVKAIMQYRGGRKEKLEQIRKERRIRDERNRLKEIYCDS